MYGSKRVFDALGLWARLADIAEPIHAVIVEDRGTGAAITYQAVEIADHPFGYGLETGALRGRLLELALERPGIEIVAPARLVAFRRAADGIAAELDDGRQLDATLIVGADGRASTVRARAGLEGSLRPYPQVALTFAIRHERPHEGRVREFLRPPGPLALLPIGQNLCSVTWIEGSGLARHLLAAPRAVLTAMLDERLGGVLGAFEIEGEPTGHPLSVHQAKRFVAPRIALAGDAAHGIHPIHAQGFNLAVRDVATLAEVLVEAAGAGRDLGDPEVLMRYDAPAARRCPHDRRGDRRPERPVLHRSRCRQAGAPRRPERARPPAAAEAPGDAPRHGPERRFAASGARRDACGDIQFLKPAGAGLGAGARQRAGEVGARDEGKRLFRRR